MKSRQYLFLLLAIIFTQSADAQIWKKKKSEEADTTKPTATQNAEQSEGNKDGDDKKEKKGPNLFTKAITKIAKVSSNAVAKATGTISVTETLDDVQPNVYHMTHLVPNSVGTVDMAFFNGWLGGGNATLVMFTKKEGFGMYKLDGAVTVDGKPAEYVSTGIYAAFNSDNTGDRKVSITTKSGQTSSFTLKPPKYPIKLISINGQTAANSTLDLTKDVTLELENPPGSENTPVTVKLSGTIIGMTSWYEVGYFPSSSKIVIPAAAFRNMNVPTNQKLNWKNAFLMVERTSIDKVSGLTGVYKDLEYGNAYSDGKYTSPTGDVDINKGLTAKSSEKFANGAVEYNVFKPNAFMSRDFRQINTIGVSSFAVRGTTYLYTEKDNKMAGTRTTKEASFPQFPDEVWDNLLDRLYKDIIPMIESEFNAKVLPIDKVVNSPSYQKLTPFAQDDANTSVEFSRAYKGGKVLSAFMPISEGYGINNADNRIMNETGSNALLDVTLDLEINMDGSKATMIPKLAVQLKGRQNGPTVSTKYFTAVVTGKGVPYKGNITAEVLDDAIVRRADLLSMLRKGLQEIKQKEAANADYKVLWEAYAK